MPRDSLRAIQTPQAFTFAKIRDAHARAAAAGLDAFTDDGGLAEWAGLEVHVFEGEAENTKLSLPADFARAAQHVRAQTETRTGLGYDVHAFGDGAFVMLGGVEIAHTQGVVAHSDGDVLLHALTDALLGALGDGDIGMHFPPSDPRWRNAASRLFFEDAVARARKRGGRILHLDATVICEAPRIGAHRDAIRASIATIAGIGEGRVSVKATTSEKLGFTGRGEGIAAQAIATLELPLTRRIEACSTRRCFWPRAAFSSFAAARGLRIATAESCTGGLVAGALTEIAGSSDVRRSRLRHLFE